MERRDELLKLFEGADDQKHIVEPLIDDIIFLESQLSRLRALPQIEVSRKDPAKQRQTEAAKLYIKFFQQYNQAVKTLSGILRKEGIEEESPLRAFLASRREPS